MSRWLYEIIAVIFLLSLISCKTTTRHAADITGFGANGKDRQDDTPAFYRALMSDQDSLAIPEGDYFVSSSKINQALRRDKIIYGIGEVRIIDQDHGVFLLIKDNNLILENIIFEKFRRPISLAPSKDISLTVKNCTFKGDLRNGIYSSHKSQGRLTLSVENCLFDGMGNSTEPKSRGGIWLDSKLDQVNIKNSTFKNFSSNRMARAICVSPIEKDCNSAYIFNNTVDNIRASQNSEIQGILVFAKKAVIENNQLSNISGEQLPSKDCEGIYTKVKECTIKGNTLTNCGSIEGVIVAKTYNKNEIPKTVIEGNQISFDKNKGFISEACGIVLRYPANSRITNNQVKNVASIGIEVTGSTTSASNIWIENNQIFNSGGAGLLLVGGDGVSQGITIKGNLIDGANLKGKKNFSPMRVATGVTSKQSIEKLVISNNEIKNIKECSSEILLQARFKNHQISDVEIEGNILESTSEHKILFDANSKKKSVGKGSIDNIKLSKNRYKNNLKSALKNREQIKTLKEN